MTARDEASLFELRTDKRKRNLSVGEVKLHLFSAQSTNQNKGSGRCHTDCQCATVGLKLSAPSPLTSRMNSCVSSPNPPSFPIFQHSLLYQYSFFFNLHHCCILCDQCLIDQYKRELETPSNLMAGVTRRMLHTAPVNKS